MEKWMVYNICDKYTQDSFCSLTPVGNMVEWYWYQLSDWRVMYLLDDFTGWWIQV